MSNYGEAFYLEELEEMQNEKVVTINPKKQIVIDKSDLDFIYKQKADLEATLAESEEKCKKAYQEGLLQKQFDKDAEIMQLKQQLAKLKEDYEQLDLSTGYYISDLKEELAEKDEEIKKLKTLIDAIDKYKQYDKDVENLVLFNPDNCYSNGHKLIIKTDKIDYGVELLEKVKDVLWTEIDSFYDDYGDRCVETADVEFFIDNQIKQLKEGK